MIPIEKLLMTVRDNVMDNARTDVVSMVWDNVRINVVANVWINIVANARDNVEATVETNIKHKSFTRSQLEAAYRVTEIDSKNKHLLFKDDIHV
jgi:hypothetical protein